MQHAYQIVQVGSSSAKMAVVFQVCGDVIRRTTVVITVMKEHIVRRESAGEVKTFVLLFIFFLMPIAQRCILST